MGTTVAVRIFISGAFDDSPLGPVLWEYARVFALGAPAWRDGFDARRARRADLDAADITFRARASGGNTFREQTSSVGSRKKLAEALDYLRDGDVLVVTKIDRLARSVADLCSIVQRIEAKGAALRILATNLDTASPTGKLMLNVIGSVAQFEREGIARAKREGRYKGRGAA